MNKRKTVILVGACLLALVLYPIIRNTWEMRRLDAKARCLRDIFVALTGARIEAEAQGQKYSPPQTLAEILDEKAKAELKRKGIDWTQIQYYPLSDDMSDTCAILSLESGEYLIAIRKGGAIFRGPKKYAGIICSNNQANGCFEIRYTLTNNLGSGQHILQESKESGKPGGDIPNTHSP